MKREIVNLELEKLEEANARLPNGEYMDLYQIKDGVFLYGVSLEGDDYQKAPLFFSPGDAILHALNPAFLKDTIGYATPEQPANSKSSQNFRFESMLRLREYRFDQRTFVYDARDKLRPPCLDVGTSNFKINYPLLLPLGYDKTMASRLPRDQKPSAMGLTVDQVLENVVSKKIYYLPLIVQAFHFCQPGKTLQIEKSMRIDMGTLWGFYTTLLTTRYPEPLEIRREAFGNTPKAKQVLANLVQDREIPSTIGDIPDKIRAGIDSGKPLEELIKDCATSVLGQKVCVSGVFFEKLWKRDVPSVRQVYSPAYFSTDDKEFWYPQIFSTAPQANKKPLDPYISKWFYSEDFQPEMGRGTLAYNWNYNRYLDVNTTMFWIIHNLQRSVQAAAYQKPVRSAFLLPTPQYNPVKHRDLIPHRFSVPQLDAFSQITIYDVPKQLQVILSFNPRPGFELTSGQPSIATSTGLYVSTRSGVGRNARSDLVQGQIQTFIAGLGGKFGNFLRVAPTMKAGLNEKDPETQVIIAADSTQSINGIPVNWLFLPLISTILRYLIRLQEFDFFVFE